MSTLRSRPSDQTAGPASHRTTSSRSGGCCTRVHDHLVRVLLVSDLHYDLRKLDWLVTQAPSYDLLAIAGDLLNIASRVPLDVQIAVVLEALARLRERTAVAVCSGNHDLDSVTAEGEKQCSWILEARESGVIVDGDTAEVAGWQVTSCAWWEGPATLATLKRSLPDQDVKSVWLWHGPPAGPLAFDGRRQHDDPELPALITE